MRACRKKTCTWIPNDLYFWRDPTPPKQGRNSNQNKGHQRVPGTRMYIDVSENNGTPKSSILIGISIINHPFWGTPTFGNPHIYLYCFLCPIGCMGLVYKPINAWFLMVERSPSLYRRPMHLLDMYLEPKWPFFWFEKALFWGVDLQNRGHWGSRYINMH